MASDASIFSPTLLAAVRTAAATAATTAERVAAEAERVKAVAQERVAAEINQFNVEAAKTEQWRADEKRTAAIQAAVAADAPPAAEPPVPRKIVFSIEDDFDEATEMDEPAPAPPPPKPPPQATTSSNASSSSSARIESKPPRWEPRLDALLTILEQEATAAKAWRDAAEDAGAAPAPMRMPAAELLAQLKELKTEILISSPPPTSLSATAVATAAATAAAASQAVDGGAVQSGAVVALQQQIEQLSAELAKAELQNRSKAEGHRRQVDTLEAKVKAAEAETADLMNLIEQKIAVEADAKASVAEAAEELNAVRTKAGSRMKALIEQNKALEEEIAQLKEVEELNQSKMKTLERSLSVADQKHEQNTKQLKADYAYARALVLRYLELEDEHEALFPALAAAFKLTQLEVQRIVVAQQQHARQNSLWGRTASLSSRLVEAARVVASEARGPGSS